jgi:hypothetical protein
MLAIESVPVLRCDSRRFLAVLFPGYFGTDDPSAPITVDDLARRAVSMGWRRNERDRWSCPRCGRR